MIDREWLASARQRCEKATPPPWGRCTHLREDPCPCEGRGPRGFIANYSKEIDSAICFIDEAGRGMEEGADMAFQLPREAALANADFISAARLDLPRALDLVEQQEREIAALREALKRIERGETAVAGLQAHFYRHATEIARAALSAPGAVVEKGAPGA